MASVSGRTQKIMANAKKIGRASIEANPDDNDIPEGQTIILEDPDSIKLANLLVDNCVNSTKDTSTFDNNNLDIEEESEKTFTVLNNVVMEDEESDLEELCDDPMDPEFNPKNGELEESDAETDADSDRKSEVQDAGPSNSTVVTSNAEESGREEGSNKTTRVKRQREKRLRLIGEDYEGLKKIDGKYKYRKCGKQREIGPRCQSSKCNKTGRHCSKFTYLDRNNIFHAFWKQMTSWSARKSYIATLVDVVVSKKKKEGSRRSDTFYYYLKRNNQKELVCKKMFLSTFGLKEWSVRSWCLTAEKKTGMHKKEISKDLRESRKRVSRSMQESKNVLKEYLDAIPKLPSHYCRASTSKMYLEPIFQSKSDVYREYEKFAKEKDVAIMGRTVFNELFTKQNLGIFRPKKDHCDLCMAHEHGHGNEEDYQGHQRRKMEAREQKQKDKEEAINNPDTVMCLTVDMQAVKLAPYLRCSAMYYKTKLCVHNFTIYNLGTAEVHCFLWDETHGSLEATNITSILISFLENAVSQGQGIKKIIIFSDGCGYQNRNVVLSNALLKFSIDRQVTIIQNFLEKGHTQMEVDSAHSLIERRLKNKDIYLPSDYIRICREARPSNPFIVRYFQFNDFLDFTKLKYYTTIRPGYKVGDPTVSDIRCLKYEGTGQITYKLNYTGEWQNFTKRPNLGHKVSIDPRYTERLKIKAEKYNHLQILKKAMDAEFWSYYENIPHY